MQTFFLEPAVEAAASRAMVKSRFEFVVLLSAFSGFVAGASVHKESITAQYTSSVKTSSSTRRIRGFAGGPSTPVLARKMAVNVSEHLKQAKKISFSFL